MNFSSVFQFESGSQVTGRFEDCPHPPLPPLVDFSPMRFPRIRLATVGVFCCALVAGTILWNFSEFGAVGVVWLKRQ